MALLELDELTRRFGGIVAVDQVSMRVEEGEVRRDRSERRRQIDLV